MTTPTTPSAIVQEMIDQLRLLQGSGEYVPLGRTVTAGTGLTGGGPLTADVTLALGQPERAAIQKIQDATWVTPDAPTVEPVANRLARRTSTGAVRTPAPVDPADAVPLQALDAEVADVVRMADGQNPLRIKVVSAATHVEANEVPGVLYIIKEA